MKATGPVIVLDNTVRAAIRLHNFKTQTYCKRLPLWYEIIQACIPVTITVVFL